MNGSLAYQGPAAVLFSTEELLIIWKYLELQPTQENAELRARIKRFLETR